VLVEVVVEAEPEVEVEAEVEVESGVEAEAEAEADPDVLVPLRLPPNWIKLFLTVGSVAASTPYGPDFGCAGSMCFLASSTSVQLWQVKPLT